MKYLLDQDEYDAMQTEIADLKARVKELETSGAPEDLPIGYKVYLDDNAEPDIVKATPENFKTYDYGEHIALEDGDMPDISEPENPRTRQWYKCPECRQMVLIMLKPDGTFDMPTDEAFMIRAKVYNDPKEERTRLFHRSCAHDDTLTLSLCKQVTSPLRGEMFLVKMIESSKEA